jgi:hypothetical protein
MEWRRVLQMLLSDIKAYFYFYPATCSYLVIGCRRKSKTCSAGTKCSS